ncbi:MAG: DNA starvation/stationary phase protection protein [Alphaproteobacteria bacterium]|nr:DNA starvation/stationary phase protection protein [Alphaproteobacteria bacterium]
MATEMTTGAAQVADALEDLLCNVIVFYFTSHRAHWNVAGPDFAEYHELFGAIYDDVYGSVDDLAENIRKCGSFPPSLTHMVETASFKDDSMTTEAKELALDIYKKNVTMIAMLKGTFDVANAANEQGVANFLAERIDMHQKWQWQLGSSLQTAGMEIPAESSAQEIKEEMSGPMDSVESSNVVVEDSVEAKELGKKLDITTIEDAMDTTPDHWTSVERRVASKYKELRNHDINKAENYLVQQVRSGFVSGKFNPLDVKV